MTDAIECPTCGASGKSACHSATGRDHKSRLREEDRIRKATRPAAAPRGWDGEAVIRVVTAEGRRVAAHGTEYDLERLAAVRGVLDDAMRTAVQGLVTRGVSWSGIGDALGVTKSAAFQRYAPKKENAA